MDLDRLNRSPIGQLVPIRGTDARHGDFAYFGYLPNPLPDDVTLASATWTAITEASTELARLGQACAQLGAPELLIRPALWREALDTSALEGTNGALRDLLESQLPSAQFLTPETIEIRAYFQMAEHAFAAIEARSLSVALLNELQERLFEETPHPPRDVGRVRRDPVWIGERDRPIHEARFVPVPPDDRLRAGLDSWEAWVRGSQPHLPPVLRAALAHYQFETLHPYADGNGRIGRLVVVLQLLGDRALDFPALTVSPWFLKRRAQYQDHLLEVSYTGEWDPWVTFFCHAIRDQCKSLSLGARRLIEWRDDAHRKVRAKRWSGAIHELLDGLLSWPVVTVGDTATRLDVSVVHATRMINHLVEIDVLKELTGRSYNRVFGAVQIMDIVDLI